MLTITVTKLVVKYNLNQNNFNFSIFMKNKTMKNKSKNAYFKIVVRPREVVGHFFVGPDGQFLNFGTVTFGLMLFFLRYVG